MTWLTQDIVNGMVVEVCNYINSLPMDEKQVAMTYLGLPIEPVNGEAAFVIDNGAMESLVESLVIVHTP